MILTDEQLHAIDVIISDGTPTTCAVTHPDVDLFDEDLRAAGFIAYAALPDFKSRRPYEKSLWVWRSDGRCVPELYALATIKFGTLPPDVNARWSDGHATNKDLSNVSLVKMHLTEDGRIARNRYGVQAGTPEYRKKYYSDPANKERQKAHSRKSAQKRRVAFQVATQMSSPTDLETLRKKLLMPDLRRGDEDDRIFDKLNEPKVLAEIATLSRTLQDFAGLTEHEALLQARDQVLGITNTPTSIAGEGIQNDEFSS